MYKGRGNTNNMFVAPVLVGSRTITEVLEDIKKNYESEKNKDCECISLYEVSKLIKFEMSEYQKMIDLYKLQLGHDLNNFADNMKIFDVCFDYNNKEVIIQFGRYLATKELRFSKNNGNIFITKLGLYSAKDVYHTFGKTISKLFDDLIKYEDFQEEFSYYLNPLNSILYADISARGVSVYFRIRSSISDRNFELLSNSCESGYSYEIEYDYKNGYNFDSNLITIKSAIEGKEEELFKKIFVNIDDCPGWSKQRLYQIREEQLIEEKRLEEEQLELQAKKQRRLELKRKLFPWINKDLKGNY